MTGLVNDDILQNREQSANVKRRTNVRKVTGRGLNNPVVVAGWLSAMSSTRHNNVTTLLTISVLITRILVKTEKCTLNE